eukprot:PITA_07031
MGWSPASAVSAFLDTVNLSKSEEERKQAEPESSEFISALAAGMNAQLIVEICSSEEPTCTIGLAVAARQTGGRLVCILLEKARNETVAETIKDLGLEHTTDFVIGNAMVLLPEYKNVDFAVIDSRLTQDYQALFRVLNLNPSRAVVVGNNVFDRKPTNAYAKTLKKKAGAKIVTLPIGKGIEVTRIGTDYNNHSSPHTQQAGDMDAMGMISKRRCCDYYKNVKSTTSRGHKSGWIMHVDEQTGEEHVFRVCKHRPCNPYKTCNEPFKC